MKWEHEARVYEDCVVFAEARAAFGGLSNMTGGYPLRVNGHDVWTE